MVRHIELLFYNPKTFDKFCSMCGDGITDNNCRMQIMLGSNEKIKLKVHSCSPELIVNICNNCMDNLYWGKADYPDNTVWRIWKHWRKSKATTYFNCHFESSGEY